MKRSDRTELALLKKAQQLDLHLKWEIADLAEEYCSTIGEFDQASLASNSGSH